MVELKISRNTFLVVCISSIRISLVLSRPSSSTLPLLSSPSFPPFRHGSPDDLIVSREIYPRGGGGFWLPGPIRRQVGIDVIRGANPDSRGKCERRMRRKRARVYIWVSNSLCAPPIVGIYDYYAHADFRARLSSSRRRRRDKQYNYRYPPRSIRARTMRRPGRRGDALISTRFSGKRIYYYYRCYYYFVFSFFSNEAAN